MVISVQSRTAHFNEPNGIHDTQIFPHPISPAEIISANYPKNSLRAVTFAKRKPNKEFDIMIQNVKQGIEINVSNLKLRSQSPNSRHKFESHPLVILKDYSESFNLTKSSFDQTTNLNPISPIREKSQ